MKSFSSWVSHGWVMGESWVSQISGGSFNNWVRYAYWLIYFQINGFEVKNVTSRPRRMLLPSKRWPHPWAFNKHANSRYVRFLQISTEWQWWALHDCPRLRSEILIRGEFYQRFYSFQQQIVSPRDTQLQVGENYPYLFTFTHLHTYILMFKLTTVFLFSITAI